MNATKLLASVLLFPLALGACVSDEDGSENTADGGAGFPDAAPSSDAPPIDASTIDAALPGVDARPAAMACAGDTLPTTVASPPITISGDINEGSLTPGPLTGQDVLVEARLISDDSLLTSVTESDGDYSLSDPNSQTTPLNAYLKATATGFMDTFVYAPYAIFEDIDQAPIFMVQNGIFGQLAFLTGINQDPEKSVLIVAVTDCNGQPVEGATVSVSPDVGTLRYAGDSGIPGVTNYPATQARGIAYIFNVPPGSYTVDGAAQGTDLRDNTVKTYAGANTTLILAP